MTASEVISPSNQTYNSEVELTTKRKWKRINNAQIRLDSINKTEGSYTLPVSSISDVTQKVTKVSKLSEGGELSEGEETKSQNQNIFMFESQKDAKPVIKDIFMLYDEVLPENEDDFENLGGDIDAFNLGL